MWIFLNNAFLSIVEKGGKGTTLLVRARQKGDIERVFPKAEVIESPRNDYRFRAQVDREEVALAVAEAVRRIDYPNFKATVKEPDRHDAYLDVWDVMNRYQVQRSSGKSLDGGSFAGKRPPVKPAKLAKPEIVLEVLAEGGALTLMFADVLAWEDPERPVGEFQKPYLPVKTWLPNMVFWAVRDETTMKAFLDEDDLPCCSLFEKTDFREGFGLALQDFMDPYQWWLLSPGEIHPWWEDAIAYELDLRFPGWQEDPYLYAKDWYSCYSWHKRLAPKDRR